MMGTVSILDLALITLLLVVGVVIGFRLAAWRVRRRIARHRRMGAKGEQRALRQLERAGYVIVATQPGAHATVQVDGDLHTFRLRGDLIVTRRGRRFLAEIKSGQTSASIRTTTTRRQLLEYALAFDVDGILLVDAHDGRIHSVSFPALEPED